MSTVALPSHLPHPFSPAGRADPYPAYRWLGEHSPVYLDQASGMWLVTSHAGCTAALRDGRFSAALGQRERARDDELPASMLTSDQPDHARLRGPGAQLLGPAAVRAAADAFDAAARSVAGRLAGMDDADVARDIGEPYAVEVFARLLAIGSGARPAFAALARRVSVNLDPLAGPAAGRAGTAAAAEFARFMDEHITELTGAGVRCPLTRLAADDRLSRGEVLGIVSLAVIGGFLPLADLAGHAVYWVTAGEAAGEPLGRLAGPPDGAVDELMRLGTPIPFTARVTREAAELGGVPLAAGARVLLMTAAANRDPAVFPDPDAYHPERSPNPHLAFGTGPHLCLGAPLVRTAGGILLGELARRFPAARQLGAARWDAPLVPRRLRGQRLLLRA